MTPDDDATPDDAPPGDSRTTPNEVAATSGDAATHQVTLPQLGESVDSGTIVAWLVEPGDRVEVDDAIAEVSTDKVDTEIPSPLAGEVVRHLVDPDDEVAVGQPILEVVPSEAAPADEHAGAVPLGSVDAQASELGRAPHAPAPPSAPPTPPSASPTPPSPRHAPPSPPHPPAPSRATASGPPTRRPSPTAPPRPSAEGSLEGGARPAPDGRLSPKVRRLLGEHGLDPTEVHGTGTDARITPDDVQRAAAVRDRAPAWPSRTDPSRIDPSSPRPSGTTARRLSPLVKRLLREHGLEVSAIEGTGTAGRITPDDVRRAADAAVAAAAAAPQPRDEPEWREDAGAQPREPRRMAEDGSRTEPLSRTRKIIAERMVTSLQTTAQLTAAVEADVTQIMYARSRSKAAAQDRYGFAPSPLAFIAKATCRALARHPVINASIDTAAGTVTFHRDVNLGIAVDTPAGLMVPVIAGAQDLGVMALQQRINDLARRARDRKLTPDDIGGGTFTITNTGSGGTLFDTPILNPPEAAILATPRIEKRPVVITDDHGNDSIAIRHRTYLCLSYDHRLIDGADAARFLTDLAGQLDTTDWEQELGELT